MKQNNFIKYTILTGLWAVLLIPFFVANTMFFPYITGKNFAFRIIIEIVFALWVYLAYVNPKYRLKFSWVWVSTAIFVAIMLVADLMGVNASKAIWSNFERMDGWMTLIHLLIYLVVFGSMMKGEKMWLWFFRSSVLSAVILSANVISEWQKTNIDRVSTTLGNPIYVAVYFLFNFFFVLILLYKDVLVKRIDSDHRIKELFKNWLFYLYGLIAILFFFDIWRTSTRGVILGLLGGLFISAITIALFEKKDKLMKKTAIGTIVVIIALVAGFIAVRDTQFVKNNVTLQRLAQISWSNVTGQGQARQYVWPMALKGAEERPILGWGQDGFNYVFNKYYDARMYGQEQWFDRAHDTPLDVLVAGGILGLLAYFLIFIFAIVVLWKKRTELGVTDAALVLGLLAGYFAQNLFVFDNLVSYFYFYAVLAYLYSKDVETKDVEVKNNNSKNIPAKTPNKDIANYVILPILILVLGGAVYYVNYKPIQANKNLIQALCAFTDEKTGALTSCFQEGFSKNLEYFKTALSYDTFGNTEIREQLLSKTPQIVQLSNASGEVKQSFVDLAFSEAQKQIAKTPNDARQQFFTGVFLDNMNQFNLATKYIEKAVELSPTKQTMIIELAKNYAYIGEWTKALEVAKKAYDEAPEFDSAKQYYYAMLVLNDKNIEAQNLMQSSQVSGDILVRIYLIRAEKYLMSKNNAEAISEINRAILTVPGFKTQGEQIIQGIQAGTIK